MRRHNVPPHIREIIRKYYHGPEDDANVRKILRQGHKEWADLSPSVLRLIADSYRTANIETPSLKKKKYGEVSDTKAKISLGGPKWTHLQKKNYQ